MATIVPALTFHAFFDDEASVWVATGDDHITTEAATREELLERLKVIVPDVLEARHGRSVPEVKIVLLT
jgi:hypothetical protein